MTKINEFPSANTHRKLLHFFPRYISSYFCALFQKYFLLFTYTNEPNRSQTHVAYDLLVTLLLQESNKNTRLMSTREILQKGVTFVQIQ